jgi:2-acylglycerol O-acyltransferase 2
VLAEVHSVPLDPFAHKQQLQQQHSLVTIPSDEMEGTAAAAPTVAAAAAVECDDDSSCRMPLLGQQQQHHHHHHYQQQRLVFRRLSSPAAAAPAGGKQQQHQVLSQLAHQSYQQQQQQPHEQSNSSNYQIDPATGERKLGVSVGLMVGGIAEMFMIRKDHERIKLKDRKGFVRIAVEHGVDLIPCYMFGVNQCLDFGPPWLQRLSRRLRASLGVIYGVWGLPIPRRVPIFKVTGKPLVVGPPMRKDHPEFAARVDELHALFCVEIERLYYAHRETYGHGFENKPLVIC